MSEVDLAGVARILAFRTQNDPEPSRGTGFLVSPTHLLTSAHVVLDGERAFKRYEIALVGHVGNPHSSATFVRIVDHDLVQDWALVECVVTPPVAYHRLVAKRSDRLQLHDAWAGRGFPVNSLPIGTPLHGTVVSAGLSDGTSYDLLELHCREAAAGTPIAGCSGGPVIVGREIVGIIRAVQADPDRAAMIEAARAMLKSIDETQGASATREVGRIDVRALGGTIYATRVGLPLEAIARKQIAGIEPDHTWFWPTLPDAPKPPEPFKDLRPYGDGDRAIYFGRETAIRDLLKLLLADVPPQVLLLRGPAGAGKSSLLAAGVTPFLKSRFDVHIEARRETGGLAASIQAARAAGLGVARPLVLVIDQSENAFRTGFEAGCDELRTLLHQVRAAFEDRVLGRSTMQLRTVIVSYRKEWHSEFSAIASVVPHVSYELAPMTRAELGVALHQIEALLKSEPYNATIDAGLFDSIKDRVASHQDALAPILQVLMTRLWREAKAQARDPLGPRVSRGLFDAEHEKIGLADYLGRQLAPRPSEAGTKDTPLEADFKSGLAHSILRFHTTRTASVRRTRKELLEEFGERKGKTVALVQELEALGLLAVDDAEAARLVHDALSPVVCSEFDKSILPGQRGLRRLEGRMRDRKANENVDFQDEERSAIFDGLAGMRRFRDDELLMLYRSAVAHIGRDLGFWYVLARERHDTEKLHDELRRSEHHLRVVHAISAGKSLRGVPELRALVLPHALAETEVELRELAAVEIADHLLPFEPREQEELLRELGARPDHTVDLLAWISIAHGTLPALPPELVGPVHVRAGFRFHEKIRTEAAQLAATRHVAGMLLILLGIAFSLLLPGWTAVTAFDASVQSVGNLMPPLAWAMGAGLLMGPWAFRRQVHGMATHDFHRSWRAFHWKFFVVAVLAQALLIGFAKSGAQLIGQGVQRPYANPSDIAVDFVISIVIASLLTCGIWLCLPLISRASVELGDAVKPSRRVFRRYATAIALALGVPLLMSALFVIVGLQLPDLCRVRVDAPTAVAIWIAMATGSATMVAAISIGVQHATELLPERRRLMERGGRLAKVQRVLSPGWVMPLVVVLAISGIVATVGLRKTIGVHTILDAPMVCQIDGESKENWNECLHIQRLIRAK